METEYLSFVRLMNEENVDYVILGGHAVIAHGFFRTTGDFAILVRPSSENAERLLTVMNRYGYTNGEFELDDFTRIPSYLSFSRHDGYTDLMTFTPGVTFDECYQNRLILDIHGTEVSFINLRELIKNKRAVGRPQDLLDIENLLSPD